MDLEMNLVELRLTGGGQDGVRFAAKLISKIGYLANGISSSDFSPTTQQTDVQRILNTELRTHLTTLDALLARDIAALNTLLRSKNLAPITVRARTPISH